MRVGCAAVLMTILACGPAAAQSSQSGFVTGGVFAGVEALSHTRLISPQTNDPDLSATVVGGVVGAGAVFNNRWIIQAEFAFPRSHETTFSIQPVPPPIPIPPPPQPTTTTTQQRRTLGGSALVGVRTNERARMRVTPLAGVTFFQERVRTRTVTQFPTPTPFPVRPFENIAYAYRTAVTIGGDVDVAVTRHVAIVPQLRVIAAGSSVAQPTSELSLRPGVGGRVSF
jgi:hypothetical protein